MVERAASKHEQHSAGEKSYTESMLPACPITQPQDNPCHRQGENHSRQVCERVEQLLTTALPDFYHFRLTLMAACAFCATTSQK